MTHWNYRIVKDKDGLYDIREVYYDDKVITAYTEHAVDFGGYESKEELITALQHALDDANKYEVLEDNVFQSNQDATDH